MSVYPLATASAFGDCKALWPDIFRDWPRNLKIYDTNHWSKVTGNTEINLDTRPGLKDLIILIWFSVFHSQ